MHLLFLRASDLFFAENMIEGMHQFRKKAIAVHKTEKKQQQQQQRQQIL